MYYDDDESNPFADPSVRQHTQMAGNTVPSATMGDYSYGGTGNQATTQPTRQQTMPPTYQQEAPRINNDDLLRRQEELDKKAAELQKKEQDLKNQSAARGPRENNFPPLPSFFPLKPCFYQDFDVDIPSGYRKTVRFLYFVWLAYVVTLFYNFIAGIVFFASAPSGQGNFGTIGVPLLYVVLFTPCSYLCWFRAVYNAFRGDSSFNFFLFFFVFFFQTCMCVLFAVGLSADYGMMGWIQLIDAFKYNTACGLIVTVSSLLFSVLAAAMAILLQRVHSHYRTTDASFSKAQAEVMGNTHVQKATASAASAAARNAFSGGAQNP